MCIRDSSFLGLSGPPQGLMSSSMTSKFFIFVPPVVLLYPIRLQMNLPTSSFSQSSVTPPGFVSVFAPSGTVMVT